jgi:predicted metal-binding membrane protein
MMAIDSALRHERSVIAVGLAAMSILAFIYIWQGAGMGMSALDMTTLSLFPHLQPNASGQMEQGWLIFITMWWVMMIAMMTPSASPLILLYGRVIRHHAGAGQKVYCSTLMLLAGYLTAWLVFSVAAATCQKALQPAGFISEMMFWSRSANLSAIVLLAAGLYQFSNVKQACLAQCRSPVTFLTEHWRPGHLGSFMLGLKHGTFCVGCCWAIMLLLFVGGVMNLIWIAVLTLFVLAERCLPVGAKFGKWSGGLLIIWAIATFLV